jgi:hypothetical protein
MKLSQLTLVTNQPDPATQFNGFENVDLEMKFPTYQNEGSSILLQ